MRASNSIYEIEEGRPFWKLRPLQILVTLILVLLLAVVVLGLIVSGPLAKAIGDAVGLGDAARDRVANGPSGPCCWSWSC